MTAFKTLLSILLALLLALLLVLGALLAWLHYADLTAHRGWIASLASRSIGREVRLEGEIGLSLWPQLHLSASQLALANADWGSEPDMASAGQVEVALRTASLWQQGPVDIQLVQASDIDLLLEHGPDGQSNLPLASTGEGAAASDTAFTGEGTGIGIMLEAARLQNLRLRQRSEENGNNTDQVYELTTLKVEADDNDDLQLQGEGRVRTLPLRLSGQIGRRVALAAGGSLRCHLAAQLADAEFTLQGQRLVPDAAGEDGQLQVEVQASGLQALLDALDIPLATGDSAHLLAELRDRQEQVSGSLTGSLGEVALKAQLDATPDRLAVEGRIDTLKALASVFAVQGLPGLPLSFAVNLAPAEQGLDAGLTVSDLRLGLGDAQLEGQGSLAGEDGAGHFELEAKGELASELMAQLPELPFQLAATIDWSAAGLVVAPLQVQLGNSDLAGELSLTAADSGDESHSSEGSKKSPVLVAALTSSRIDLVQWQGEPQEPAASDASTKASTANESAIKDPAKREPTAASTRSASEPARYVFGEAALPLAALQDNRIDVQWQIAALHTRLLVLEDVAVKAVLQDGRLDISADVTGADGGEGRNRLVLDNRGEQPQLSLNSQLRDFRINLASGEVEKAEDIPPLSLSLELAASGASPRALAAGSDGKAMLTMGPGLLTNSIMETFSGDLLAQLVSALNPFAKTQAHMAFQCGVVAMEIDAGQVSIEPVAIQTEKLQVVASGEVDLTDEAINIVFNTKPRKGVGVSADMFVTPFVSLEGTLAAPRIGLDEKGTLLTAGAAVATGGMSILWKGLMDRATGTVDHCEGTFAKYTHAPLPARESR
ncbi:AsmA family protein [Parahaliea mediterranea]|uniref:AsmA family protein n=1 Tax=Parahaliea mediterranea TaxID=651086 RepID=UPI000E2EC92D|nr:AsmA family protein [Parahaliea mediterranea]